MNRNLRHNFIAFLLVVCVPAVITLSFPSDALAQAKPGSLRMIVTTTEKKAADILREIKGGRHFALVAKEKSVHRSRERYGELDSSEIRSLPPAVKKALSPMREGDIRGVIKSGKGSYAIIYYVDLSAYRLGARAYRAGDFDNAETNLLRHIEANPDAVKARILLGDIYEKRKNHQRSEELYRGALALDPDNPEAKTGLARVAKALPPSPLPVVADTIPAEKKQDKMLKEPVPPEPKTVERKKEAPVADKTMPPVTQPLTTRAPKAAVKQTALPGVLQLRMIIVSSEDEAREILSDIKRGKPFFFVAYDRAADKKVAEDYGLLGEVDPSTLHPAIQRALTDLQEGQSSGIIRVDFSKFALVHIIQNVHYLKGEKAFVEGDIKGAREHLQKHLLLNPDHMRAGMMLGSVYQTLGDFKMAEEVYRQAMFFRPKTTEPYERLGNMFMEKLDYEQARAVFSKGLAQVPSSRVLAKLLEITDIALIGTGN